MQGYGNGRKITSRLAAAVLLIDNFTNEIITKDVKVISKGLEKPFFKPNGYFVFSDIDADINVLELTIKSKYYLEKEVKISLTDIANEGYESIIRLNPSKYYPLPNKCTVVEGKTSPRSEVFVYSGDLQPSFVLGSEYISGSGSMQIYNQKHINLNSCRMYISSDAHNCSEIFTVNRVKDFLGNTYFLEQGLKGSYSLGTTRITHVFSGESDDDGNFYIPIHCHNEYGSKLEFFLENITVGLKGLAGLKVGEINSIHKECLTVY